MLRVPDAEGKVAKEVRRAVGAPELVRGERESDVRRRAQTPIEAGLEPADQRRAIVQTSVHDHAQPVATREGLWRVEVMR